jgi:hypothetical protein
MTRSIVSGLLGLLSVIAVGSIPTACQSGGVGDPCVPEDEYDSQFAGFKVSEENIESRSFQCETRICLVNHFQGRVSCPLGQQAPASCNTEGEGCGDGMTCKRSQILSRNCETNGDCAGAGGVCDGGVCRCENTTSCPTGFQCECETDDPNCSRRQCSALVCASDACQVPLGEGVDSGDLAGKNCCIPGTDTPIASPVCGQCNTSTKRDADSTVYCSCRCGVADGAEEDPNFNFCECPDGFVCEEIRKSIGLGDEQITGKYCIKNDTKFERESQCDTLVEGGLLATGANCQGSPP